MDIDAPTGVWNITLRGIKASDVLTPSIHLAPTGASPPLAPCLYKFGKRQPGLGAQLKWYNHNRPFQHSFILVGKLIT